MEVWLEGVDQGGPTERAAPCYGEDNGYVYEGLLGLTKTEIHDFEDAGII